MRTVSCSKNANAMYALFVIMPLKSWNLNLPDNMATPLTRLVFFYPLVTVLMGFYCIECFHMTSWWPYWCPKTMKQRPCWCPKPIMWELNSFVMQTLSFVPINLHRCWPREWKHSINGLALSGHSLSSCGDLFLWSQQVTVKFRK